MEEEIQKAEEGVKKAWPFLMSWVGGISALIGLFASIAGGVTWFSSHQKHKAELQAKMALAQSHAKQGEYQASIQIYDEILKDDPLYRPALDEELSTAMLWAEDFHVPGQNSAALAAPLIDQMMTILESGLKRSKGLQAADVQAHIGWAHWLNQDIAEREFGPLAEQNFRAALAADPTNVYAHGMLGYWMVNTDGNFTEAMQHLKTAVATGKVRPLVRNLQFGSLVGRNFKGVRTELMKVSNEMRKAGESIDHGYKKSAFNTCLSPQVTDHGELTESLTAIPADEAWATYLWLDDRGPGDHQDEQQRKMEDEFIQANLLEISGKRQEALEQFRVLQKQLKDTLFTMRYPVNAAVVRLGHG